MHQHKALRGGGRGKKHVDTATVIERTTGCGVGAKVELLSCSTPPLRGSLMNEGRSGRVTYLERVTTLGFSIDHLHDVLVQFLAGRVSLCPIVSCTTTILGHEDVLGVVQVRIRRCQYVVDDLQGVHTFQSFISLTILIYQSNKRTRGSRSTRIARGM